jgi:hypothetical protein
MSSREYKFQVAEEQNTYIPAPIDEPVKTIDKELKNTLSVPSNEKVIPVEKTPTKKREVPQPHELDLNSMSRAARNAPGSSVPEHWFVRTVRDGWETVTASSE